MTTIKEWRKHVKAAQAAGRQPRPFVDFLQASDPQRYAVPIYHLTGNPPPPNSGVGERVQRSGIYTQGALDDLQNLTQTRYVTQPPGIAGTYWDNRQTKYGGQQTIELDPSATAQTAIHEYNHFFDDQHNITDLGSRYGYPDLQKFAALYPGGGPQQTGALRENAFLGTAIANTRQARLQGEYSFPTNAFAGMFGAPMINIPSTQQQWGGRAEYYASVGELPYRNIPPDMRKFYPQFNQSAYQVPPGLRRVTVKFEDGSIGDIYVNLRNRPGRWR